MLLRAATRLHRRQQRLDHCPLLITGVRRIPLRSVLHPGQSGSSLRHGHADTPTLLKHSLSALAVLVHDALPARAAQAVAWLATEAGVPPNAVRSALDEL